MKNKRNDTNRQDAGFNVRLTTDQTLSVLFECSHGNIVCARCIGTGRCEHDCQKCFDELHGEQLGLFEKGEA